VAKRAASEWVIAMLADTVSDVPTADIQRDFARYLPGVRVFFPAETCTGTIAWAHAYGGYAFLEVSPDAHVQRVERSRFVDKLVRTSDGQAFERLSPTQMKDVRRSVRPRLLRRGSKVRLLLGAWTGMTGKVQRVDKRQNRADVQIRLHSRHISVRAALYELERV